MVFLDRDEALSAGFGRRVVPPCDRQHLGVDGEFRAIGQNRRALDDAATQLAKWLRAADLELEDVSGLMYEPWRNCARVVSRTDINYLACARKPA